MVKPVTITETTWAVLRTGVSLRFATRRLDDNFRTAGDAMRHAADVNRAANMELYHVVRVETSHTLTPINEEPQP